MLRISFYVVYRDMIRRIKKLLIESLFTNVRRESFAKLSILKLSLHNSAAFCLRQKLHRDLPENVTL